MSRFFALIVLLANLVGCYATVIHEDPNDAGRRTMDATDANLHDNSAVDRDAASDTGPDTNADIDVQLYITVEAGTKADAGTDANSGTDADVEIDAALDPILIGISTGVYDPNEVYILGTLSEGACYRDAVAHWSNPNLATVGFDCYFYEVGAMIRPDGILLYSNTFEGLLREFHCDDCPGWTIDVPYPRNVLDNDTILPTPCETVSVRAEFIVGIDGNLLYKCSGDWYTENGEALSINDKILSYGYNDFLLLLGETNLALYNLVNGEETPVDGFEIDSDTTTLASRVNDQRGFWLVTLKNDVTSLWSIDYSGSATLEGTYPERGEAYGVKFYNVDVEGFAGLNPFGGLFQIAHDLESQTFEDVIVYRTIDGDFEVVYTETADPLVKLHGPSFATGP